MQTLSYIPNEGVDVFEVDWFISAAQIEVAIGQNNVIMSFIWSYQDLIIDEI